MKRALFAIGGAYFGMTFGFKHCTKTYVVDNARGLTYEIPKERKSFEFFKMNDVLDYEKWKDHWNNGYFTIKQKIILENNSPEIQNTPQEN